MPQVEKQDTNVKPQVFFQLQLVKPVDDEDMVY